MHPSHQKKQKIVLASESRRGHLRRLTGKGGTLGIWDLGNIWEASEKHQGSVREASGKHLGSIQAPGIWEASGEASGRTSGGASGEHLGIENHWFFDSKIVVYDML